jgi:hypothetical protein
VSRLLKESTGLFPPQFVDASSEVSSGQPPVKSELALALDTCSAPGRWRCCTAAGHKSINRLIVSNIVISVY